MENYVFRRDLVKSRDLLQLSEKSDSVGLTRLAVHLLLVGGSGLWVWSAQSSWWILPAWFAYGTIVVFLFAPLHECIHRTAFRSRGWNNIVAAVAGFILILPANYFRHFHFEHHRHTNDPARDPELLTEKPRTFPGYMWTMTGLTSYWLPQIRLLLHHASGNVNSKFIPKSAHRAIQREARIHLALYVAIGAVSIYLQSALIATFWVVPILIGMVSLRLFLLAEHGDCELSPNMLVNTRTTLTNPLLRLITWNMSFHCEHHLYPSVPFHRLPILHDKVRKHLGTVSSGYLEFHREYLRSM
ncbi:MAG: fatty acid desaturase [Acidiferrobacterales bacterium]|nr:fatty acid desaturase [Acidiferrobacterales bacterium]